MSVITELLAKKIVKGNIEKEDILNAVGGSKYQKIKEKKKLIDKLIK